MRRPQAPPNVRPSDRSPSPDPDERPPPSRHAGDRLAPQPGHEGVVHGRDCRGDSGSRSAQSYSRSDGGPLEIERATIRQLGASGVDVVCDTTDVPHGSVREGTRGALRDVVRPASAGEGDHGLGDWSGCFEWLKVAGVRDVDDGPAFAELFPFSTGAATSLIP
jgi:hypothetical protein